MERAGMQEYFGEVRAYFAPVNRATETGTVFDPSLSFDLNNPPSPWVGLGLVRNFKRVDQVDHGDGEERSGGSGADAVSEAGGCAGEPGFLRVGQAADGVGGEFAAHERAGERGHAGAGFGRSCQARPTGSGGFDGVADSGGSFGSRQLRRLESWSWWTWTTPPA